MEKFFKNSDLFIYVREHLSVMGKTLVISSYKYKLYRQYLDPLKIFWLNIFCKPFLFKCRLIGENWAKLKNYSKMYFCFFIT